MDKRRREFFSKAFVAGAGAAAVFRGMRARAKGLPSDPGEGKPKAGPDEIVFPRFEKDLSVPLDQALLQRSTERSFDPDKQLTMEQVSRIMWAANGVNRKDGHRTTPSAVARYPVEVYAALPQGVYLFVPKEHKLVKQADKDIRSKVPITQPGLKRAAMDILYVIDNKRMLGLEEKWADVEIGCMVQSAYLMAAAMDLGSTVFALVAFDRVTGLMGLPDNRKLRLAQAVGPLRQERF